MKTELIYVMVRVISGCDTVNSLFQSDMTINGRIDVILPLSTVHDLKAMNYQRASNPIQSNIHLYKRIHDVSNATVVLVLSIYEIKMFKLVSKTIKRKIRYDTIRYDRRV